MYKALAIILLLPLLSTAQVDFQSSNLPIITINTDGVVIPLDDKTTATIEIIYNGPGQENNVSDIPAEYSGHCGIEIRGESSTDFDKKSYSIEMWDEEGNDIDASFLGFPEEEDFILYGPYSDKTLMNNVFAMKLANDLDQYASRTQYVELILNEEYAGLYVLMEKIKRDKNRVDISKLKADENSGDDLTGGYIIRIDHSDGERGWESNYDKYRGEEPVFFQYYYPPDDEITIEQEDYIQDYVSRFEDALMSPTFRDENGKHYSKYIHLRSFIDNFLINELVKNVDAFWLSSYFHKDKESKGGKLRAGPIWDYNLSMGNAGYCNTVNTWGWMYYTCSGESPFWWDRFFNNFTFTTVMSCRWEALRDGALATDTLMNYIDAIAEQIGPAAERNFQLYPILGTYVWPNSDVTAGFTTHAESIEWLKEWIAGRLEWMDENLPGEALNCGLFADPDFEVSGGTDTEELIDNKLTIYPIPADDQLHISTSENIIDFIILNRLGQKVLHKKYLNKNYVSLDLSTINTSGLMSILVKTRDNVYHRSVLLSQ